MTQKFKVLVTRKWPKKVEEKLLSTFDATLNVEDKPLSESELIEGMKSYDALLQKFKYGDALNEALAARDPRGVRKYEVIN